MSYTPGPWAFYESKDGISVHQADSAPYTPESSSVCDLWLTGNPLEIQVSNGRLIAAAPELLQALKNILECVGFIPGSEAEKMARTAIAKAEGKS